MRGIRFFVSLISFLVLATPAESITLDVDGAEYTATTAETIQAAWTASVLTENGVSKACPD